MKKIFIILSIISLINCEWVHEEDKISYKESNIIFKDSYLLKFDTLYGNNETQELSFVDANFYFNVTNNFSNEFNLSISSKKPIQVLCKSSCYLWIFELENEKEIIIDVISIGNSTLAYDINFTLSKMTLIEYPMINIFLSLFTILILIGCAYATWMKIFHSKMWCYKKREDDIFLGKCPKISDRFSFCQGEDEKYTSFDQ